VSASGHSRVPTVGPHWYRVDHADFATRFIDAAPVVVVFLAVVVTCGRTIVRTVARPLTLAQH
jgi:hypothetical protein